MRFMIVAAVFDLGTAAGRQCFRSDRSPALRLQLVRLRMRISRPSTLKPFLTNHARRT